MPESTLNLGWIDRFDRLDQQEIKRKLSSLRRLVHLITEMGHDGILALDDHYAVKFANKLACELLDVVPDQIIGRDFRSFLRTEDIEFLIDMHREAQKTGSEDPLRVCSEFTLKSASENLKTVEVCLVLYHDDRVTRTFVYLYDVTGRVQAESEIMKANDFLKNIIQQSVDGIIAADMKGNIIIFNQGAERMLGFRPEEAQQKIHITELYHPPEFAKEVMSMLRSGEHGGKGKLENIQVYLKDSSGAPIPCSLSAAIVYEQDREVASVGIFTDLRERIEMKKKLDEAQLQLIQSEKMASLGKLAAGVAHEINNPLGGILMYATMLLEECDGSDQIKSDLQLIVDQALRCKDIVQNLLDFSRQSGGQKTSFDLNESLQKVVALFKNQALFHNIDTVQEFQPGLPLVDGDPSQINQVITNLVLNAAQAMDGKGTLTLITRASAKPDRVEFVVRDTGCGISEEDISKVFDPFFTTKPVGKGTGLGLSTAYGIIERHGGAISVRSKVGAGTAFTVELPARRAKG